MLTNSEMKKLNEEIANNLMLFVDSVRKIHDKSVTEMTEKLPEFQMPITLEIDRTIYKAEILNEFSKRIPGYINDIYLEYYDPDSEN